MAKSSKKSNSKIVPHPQFLLMGANIVFEKQRFDTLVVGSPFTFEDAVYMKVGASSALCLQAGEDREDRLPQAAGLKVTFRKSCKVELANVDLTVRMLGGVGHPLPQIVKFPCERPLKLAAGESATVRILPETSDITQSVVERAGS